MAYFLSPAEIANLPPKYQALYKEAMQKESTSDVSTPYAQNVLTQMINDPEAAVGAQAQPVAGASPQTSGALAPITSLTPEQRATYDAAVARSAGADTSFDYGQQALDTFAQDREVAQQQANIEAFKSDPQFTGAMDQFIADPSEANYRVLNQILANAPVNFQQDMDAASGAWQLPEYSATLRLDELSSLENAQAFGRAQMEYDKDLYNPLSMQNLGPALGIAGAALAPWALGSLGGLGAGAAGVTGSAAAPFGYAGATGVGAGMAEAAGLGATALGAAGPAIASAPNLLGQISNVPTSVPSTGGAPAAGGATGGGAMASADSLIPGISNSDLLNFGGAAASGITGMMAAGSVADTQTQAAREAAALAEPWRQAGIGALGQLETGMQAGGDLTRPFTMADFQTDPGAQFREEQGNQKLQNYLAQTGQVESGEARQENLRFGQGLAAQEYGQAYNRYTQNQGNTFNRLAALSGIGQTATQQIASLGTSAGAAQAAGTMGQANALSGAIGQGLSMYNTGQTNQQNLAMQNKWLGVLAGGA